MYRGRSKLGSTHWFVLICAAIALSACSDRRQIEPETVPINDVFPDLATPGPFEKAYTLTETSDGMTRVFVRESPGETNLYMVTQDDAGTWSQPTRLDLPKTVSNTSPHFSPFDNRLYYASDAPLPDSGRVDMNIWSVDWSDGSWGSPSPVLGDINTDDNETSVTTDRLGNMYFVSKHPRGQGAQDIYTARQNDEGEWQTVFLPEHINSPRVETHVSVSPDGGTLIFYSYQTPKIGKVDLVASLKRDDEWQAPRNLGPMINTADNDIGASFSFTGQTFYWSRNGVIVSTDRNTLDELVQLAFEQPKSRPVSLFD